MWEKVEEWGVPPMPVLSPCCGLDMALGTGALFNVGFVSVAEASIITGTGSGGTNCGELHPGFAKAGPRLVDSLGWAVGAHPLGSVDGLQQTGEV